MAGKKISRRLLLIILPIVLFSACCNNYEERKLSFFENVHSSTTFLKKPLRYLSCRSRAKRLKPPAVIVLAYHNVFPVSRTDDLYTVSLRNFKDQLQWLTRFFPVISVKEIGNLEKLSRPSVVITFDDGTKNNYTDAFPALLEQGITATFFIVTDFVGTGGYVNWDECAEMQAKGMSICSHSCTHPDFGMLQREQALTEFVESRKKLEEMAFGALDFFAYPAGNPHNMKESDRELIDSAGYRYCFAYGGGAFSIRYDRYRIPRYMVVDIQGVTLVEQILSEFEKLAKQ